MHLIDFEPKFSLGLVRYMPGAKQHLTKQDVAMALFRHLSGDWGEVDEFEWKVNDDALDYGGRLLSVYRTVSGIKFYVITERDCSQTTFSLPEEYRDC